MVQVSVWAGMSEENKKKVVEGMTRVLEELGISPSQLGKTQNFHRLYLAARCFQKALMPQGISYLSLDKQEPYQRPAI